MRDASRALDGARRDLGRLLVSVVRDEDAVYSEWISYVRAVGDYLGLVDGSWAVAE